MKSEQFTVDGSGNVMLLLFEFFIAEDVHDDSSEYSDEDDTIEELVTEIPTNKEATGKNTAGTSEANELTPNKKRSVRGSIRSYKKKQRLSKQEEFKKCMKEFTKSQKESDEKFLEEMKHQTDVDAELRKQELKVYTDSMALLAKAFQADNNQAQQCNTL